ncbi:MAG: tetratricopeptide repeat protein [Chloroflexi bacterium]|nr:tetratricopeptide repeat protein [Chloroflexota bacterium]MCI0575288.1 tetratricopeptide repeat protein [Chloroflexota bacterium]MCI0646605.1 tetratricopeptide repeat protein [Chloroflexota bacterium]MCI0729768.1 tetratricopeptide repeat protein [Chloroflexota bacterium]
MDKRLELHVLGKLRLVYGGRVVTDALPVKSQALLCYLAVTGHSHTRHALAGLLWGDAPEEKAKASLRVALAGLRKLCPDHLITTHQTVAFNRESDYWLDVEDFGKSIAHAAIGTLQTAIKLYRGDFLEDFFVEGALAFEEWALAQRAHWQQLALQGLARLSDEFLARQSYAEAIAILNRRLAIEPWNEAAHYQLMVAYARLGNFNSALAQYESCRSLLAGELDVEPRPETTNLYERILVARMDRPARLPVDESPFIGRQTELDKIDTLLGNPDCRLLTIVGMGGAGKTRLALAAARRIVQKQALLFLNGVVFVPLAGAASAEAIPLSLAYSLNVTLASPEKLFSAILNYLRHKEMLLVLDNFEQLLSAPAGVEESGADYLARIISACPALKLLVTSREPLQLAAEWRLDLEGLDYPRKGESPAGDGATYSAVELFKQRAQQVRPDFQLAEEDLPVVYRLCRLTAGIPLALKLAAAWLRLMPLQDLVIEIENNMDVLTSQMRDVPPRQRSMRAIFDYTWELLAKPEQQLFQAMAVFRGGCTREAAMKVAGARPFLLARLVDHQLVQPEQDGRYELHELARQYAADKLGNSQDQATMAGRHGAYYLELVRQQEPALYGRSPRAAAAILEREIDNIRQAWRWAVQEKAFEQLGGSIEALAAFYEVVGLFDEAMQSFGGAADRLAVPVLKSDPAIQEVRCHLLAKAAEFAEMRGDYDQARAWADQAIALADQPGQRRYLADAHRTLGIAGRYAGQLEREYDHLKQAIAIYESLEAIRPLAIAYDWLGLIASDLRELDVSLEALQRAAQLHAAAGNERGLVFNKGMTAIVYTVVGRLEEALAYQQEVLHHYEKMGYLVYVARTANNIGLIQHELGAYETALQQLEYAIQLQRQIGSLADMFNSLGNKGEVHLALGAYGEARRCLQQAWRFFQEAGMALLESENAWRLGKLYIEMGEYAHAEKVLGQCLALSPAEENPEAYAIAHSLLGQMCWRQGGQERALDHFNQAMTALERAGRLLALASFAQVPRAMLLLELGDIQTAQAALDEVQPLLGSVGRNPIVVESQLLAARIALARGELAEAEQQLQKLLAGTLRPAERAAVLYELWRMTGDEAYGRLAMELYQALTVKTPNVVYLERLRELKRP